MPNVSGDFDRFVVLEAKEAERSASMCVPEAVPGLAADGELRELSTTALVTRPAPLALAAAAAFGVLGVALLLLPEVAAVGIANESADSDVATLGSRGVEERGLRTARELRSRPLSTLSMSSSSTPVDVPVLVLCAGLVALVAVPTPVLDAR